MGFHHFSYCHGVALHAALLMVTGIVTAGHSAAGAGLPAKPSVRFSGTRLMEIIKVLSSDEFEGRGVATKGEELTTAFIEKKFKALGLVPGNPDGTYFQGVPMVGITADPSAQLVLTDDASGKKLALKSGDDFVAWTKREQPEVSVDAELIFVGYGVVAPEYHWDDFKDVDVKGKVIVVLINDPPVPDPQDPRQLDPNTFKGKAMTYYGRWTYKFEEAARRGAAGCLIVHETGPAGYPWGVVKTSNTGEQFDLVREDKGMSRSAVEGWMTYDQAKALFALTGKDFDALEKAAVSREFRPVPLGAKAALTLHNATRTIQSKNVIAKFEGSDPKLRDEYVIYSAHWDHLGIGPEVKGDKIYHGAE
ncbi:MAG: M28 family peptidase, partial [Acidobacteriia bacterium]|nr:M28 family peptidase [Terriglobia bacterium]